jgi:hypothetical protein
MEETQARVRADAGAKNEAGECGGRQNHAAPKTFFLLSDTRKKRKPTSPPSFHAHAGGAGWSSASDLSARTPTTNTFPLVPLVGPFSNRPGPYAAYAGM